MSQAAAGRDNRNDGSASRPSGNNRQGPDETLCGRNLDVAPSDLPDGSALRPVSVEEDRNLRDEAVFEASDGTVQARPWYSVLNEWRDWYDGYLRSNIEFQGPDGEIVRSKLENSYMPEYGKRYYAKLKDFERGAKRELEGMTTVMLTFTASTLNANGSPRCPADHMRDIMEGYDAARKQLHQVLSGRNWEYARVWEPHDSGYGHLHMAVFVEDPDATISGEQFEPVMRSHVENCGPAGTEAHRNKPCSEHAGEGPTPWESAEPSCDDCDVAVSVNDDVENLGSYVSEYIGIFGDETLERPMKEQMFYAVTWATNTRRVDFSNGAQEMMAKEQFVRETGLRPEDRGGESFERWKETGDPDGETSAGDWSVEAIETVSEERGYRSRADPQVGGVEMTQIAGRSGVDPPPKRE